MTPRRPSPRIIAAIASSLTAAAIAASACAPAVEPAAAPAHDQLDGTQRQTADDSVARIDRAGYQDKLRGMWLAECIANWTGLQTEFHRIEPPFYTDADWAGSGGTFDFILDQEPWLADDDTDIEYMYQHLLSSHGVTELTPEQIRDGWLTHIEPGKFVWASNEHARNLMQDGMLPPETSLPENNPHWEMIDAQLTTEIFGALAPGMPDKALTMAHLPIRTVARGDAALASEFHVVMYSLAATVDANMTRGEQVRELAEQARTRVPDSSYIADMYDFVKADWAANPDKSDWESTRDKVYQRYVADQAGGYGQESPLAAGINFAAGLVSLFYGDGDLSDTIRIGSLAGWDSDNPTATWGGLLGLLYGYEGVVAEFGGQAFSDAYRISRTRVNHPEHTPDDPNAEDTFALLAARGTAIADLAVSEAGGRVAGDEWLIPSG